MLALIYLSASIAFAAPHSHDHGSSLPEQCAACAWHSDSNTDVPVTPNLIRIPPLRSIHTPRPDILPLSQTLRSLRDRGPPLHSCSTFVRS